MKLIVNAGHGEYCFEAESDQTAIDAFVEQESDIGFFIEVYEPRTANEDKRCYMAVKELLRRHKIHNKDVVNILNKCGLSPEDEHGEWYKLLKENAHWFKNNPIPEGDGGD